MTGRRALLAAALLAPAVARGSQPRIVVAGGGAAEILVALGLRDALVGADSTAQFPAALRRLPQVGYLRALSAEGVLSLRPDLLVLAHEAGPPPVLAQLRTAGLRIVQAPRVQSAEDIGAAIAALAAATGREEAGRMLAAALAEDLAALAAALPRLARPPRALFVLGSGGSPMASGRGTAGEAMLRLAGARSAIESYEGYRAISAEAALSAAPDWIVAPSHAVDAAGGAEALLRQPQFALLAAARTRRLVSFDSLYLLGFGPRTAHAARDLAASLHGQPDLAALPDRPWLRDAA